MNESAYAAGQMLGGLILLIGLVWLVTFVAAKTWRHVAAPAPAAGPRATTAHRQRAIGIGLFVLAAAVLVATVMLAW